VKRSLFVLIVGETGVGKSHAAMSLGNSVMLDTTINGDAEVAAWKVYGDEFGERYYRVSEYEQLCNVIEECEVPVVCIDTGDSLRDVLAREYIRRVNEGRSEDKKVKKIYPVTEWGKVYDLGRELFYSYAGEKTFVITEGMKDEYVGDKPTGKKVPDGLKMLPAMADIVVNVKIVGGKRKFQVVKNRFIDKTSEEWIKEVGDLKVLFDEIEKVTGFKKEWLVV